MIINDNPEYVIEHYGKKGMKWGTRSNTADRQRNKELNRKSREKDRKTIEKARARVNSGKTQSDYKKAKSQHAANKAKLGTREARRILAQAREKKYEEVAISQTAKDGKEIAISIAAGAAFVIGYAALSAAMRR